LQLCLAAALAALFASILPWGFLWLVFWRGLVGAAVGVMMIYCLSIATRHAPSGKLGAATGIAYTGVGIGILLSGTLVPLLLQQGLAAAWAGVAVLGIAGAAIGFWGWRMPDDEAGIPPEARPMPAEAGFGWTPAVIGLVVARVFFTLGLIPHTIYWVDYLVRGLDHGMGYGGAHWALFGLGALCGTYLWGRLADWLGFRLGLALAFTAIAIGTALPVLVTSGWALITSSVVVGAQPGLTAILSGRVHQIMGADRMAGVWRMSALVSTVCQAAAGYLYVSVFALTGSYTPIFLLGGLSMALGAATSFLLAKDQRYR
jgi:predicted MFS family arabinose efflux permease